MPQIFEHTRCLIAHGGAAIRSSIKAALQSIGFRTLAEVDTFPALLDAMAKDTFDLLITGTELDRQETGMLIRRMRNQQVGSNPFPVVITLLAQADPDLVRRVIDSGADDLLLSPISADQLTSRLDKLLQTRKPFVVTYDYVGPDRRTKARAFNTRTASLLPVPNPLKATALNPRMKAVIDMCVDRLNQLKIERCAAQLEWLTNRPDETGCDVAAMQAVIGEMMRRTEGDGNCFAPLIPSLTALQEQVAALGKTSLGKSQISRLNDLAKDVWRAHLDCQPAENVAQGG